MKNAFYFMLKALFVLKILKLFCPDFFGNVGGKRLDKKAKVSHTLGDK